MANSIQLTEGWKLHGGFAEPLPLCAPMPIQRALAEAGVIAEAPVLADAWAFLVPWRYELSFDAPEEEDERHELYFEQLTGSGEMHLNGEKVADIESGECRVDVTEWLLPKNRLSLSFHPVLPGSLSVRPMTGMAGSAALRATNYVTLHHLKVSAGEAEIALTAHVSGKFSFNYIVMRGGETIRHSVQETLRASRQNLRHNISVQGDPSEVRLMIERSGIGCENASVRPRQPGGAPALSIDAREFFLDGFEKREALAKELGASALMADGGERMTEPHALLAHSLASRDGSAVRLTAAAPKKGAAMRDPMIYFHAPELPDLRRFGEGTPKKLVSALRTLQAELIARQYRMALIRGRTAEVLELLESAPAPASCALVEASGEKRPAFAALCGAARRPHAFALPPEYGLVKPGALVRIPIWYIGDTRTARPLSVYVSCYAADGRVIGGASYTAFSNKPVLLGEVAVDVPSGAGLMLVRTQTTGYEGGEGHTADVLLIAGDGECPLSALMTPRQTTVMAEGAAVHNTGGGIAFSVAMTARGHSEYAALLPGEKRTLPFVPAAIEYLNE